MNEVKKEKEKWIESLRSYLQAMPVSERKAFAERCGTTPGQLNMISWGNNSCSAKLAVALHRETNGAVSMEELHPDLDWQYLRKTLANGKVELDEEALKNVLHESIDNIDLNNLPVKLAVSKRRAQNQKEVVTP